MNCNVVIGTLSWPISFQWLLSIDIDVPLFNTWHLFCEMWSHSNTHTHSCFWVRSYKLRISNLWGWTSQQEVPSQITRTKCLPIELVCFLGTQRKKNWRRVWGWNNTQHEHALGNHYWEDLSGKVVASSVFANSGLLVVWRLKKLETRPTSWFWVASVVQ